MRTRRTAAASAVPLAAVLTAALVLAGCTSAPEGPAPTSSSSAGATAEAPAAEAPAAGSVDARLAELGLDAGDGRALVEDLDRLPVAERPADVMASVRTDHVLVSVTGGEQEVPVPLPDDEFYVSFAPYVDGTHDCFYHSLTTCRGELGGQEVDVRITDDATGDVLVDETTTLFDNGFVGYWLPRGVTATLEVEQDGRTATTTVLTDDEAPTCLTTLQLV